MSDIRSDIKYMERAIKLAKKADDLDEVPIGCVIVYDGEVVGEGYNRRNLEKSVLSHAEIFAISEAEKKLGDWRLEGATMYVSLEPCPMCAGAILQSRLSRLVIGARSQKAGSVGTIINLLNNDSFNHQVELTYDVCEKECSELLSNFFRRLRGR